MTELKIKEEDSATDSPADIESRRLKRMEALAVRKKRERIFVTLLCLGAVILAARNQQAWVPKKRAVAASARAVTADQTAKRFKPVAFTAVSGTDLSLALPAEKSAVLGIGYHQAYNVKALPLASLMDLVPEATTQSVLRVSHAGRPASFVMFSRGRGSVPTSSVDVAVVAGTVIKSPVSGTVLEVVPYALYGRIDDVRIDILAEGHPEFKISIVHVDQPAVVAGQRVRAGETPLARVRPLGIKSQIDDYLGGPVAHTHIQVNPIDVRPQTAEAGHD